MTLDNTTKTVDNRFFITYSGSYLYINTDYTVVHKSANTTITFLINVFNEQPITVAFDTIKLSAQSKTAATLSAGFKSLIERAGKPMTIKYFSQSTGSVWDDDTTLTEIINSQITTSGIVIPLSNKFGSEDVNLLEQGKLRTQDQKLYVNGSLNFTGVGSNLNVKIVMGTDSYTLVPLGGIPYEVENVSIYKKSYIRLLTNGSLIGE